METDGIDDQFIPLKMTDGFAVIGRSRMPGMQNIHIDVPDLRVGLADQQDFFCRLQDVDRLKPGAVHQEFRNARRPATRAPEPEVLAVGIAARDRASELVAIYR